MTYMTAYLRQHRWLFVSSMLFASLALIAFYALNVRAGAGASDPILEINTETLTSYNYTGASDIQDIHPRSEDRGTGIDGTLRVRPALPMAIHGNPFETGFRKSTTSVRESNGTTAMHVVDLKLPSEGFSWEISRSFNGRQRDYYDSLDHDSNGYQGVNWFQNSQPELLPCVRDDCEVDIIYIVYAANAYAEYARIESTDRFKGTNGAAGIIEKISGTPDIFVLTDQHSNKITFFGHDGAAGVAAGQIWKMEDPAQNVAYVGDASSASTAISNGYDASGRIEEAFDTNGRRYTYSYTSAIGGTERLESVVVEHKPVSTWIEIASVTYSYHDGASARGSAGDLESVQVIESTSDASYERWTHYRYWKGSGLDHLIKYVLGAEGCRAYDLYAGGLDQDFLTAADAAIETYAEAYFEYDGSRRVDEAGFNGDCGCAGGSGSGSYLYAYDTNSGFSGSSGYDTEWYAQTVIERPDGAFETHYYDETHEHLSFVLTDDDPDNMSPPKYWATSVVRDSNGCVTEVRTPANADSYTHSSGTISPLTSAGEVRFFDRYASGACKGFLEDQWWREGTSGTKYFTRRITYSDESLAVAAGQYVLRPFIATVREYYGEETSGTANSFLTTITTTVHTSPDTLAIEQVTIDEPKVLEAENGSDSVTTRKQYFNRDGTLQFTRNTEGTIGYYEYTGGQPTKKIDDVNTSHGDLSGVTIPTGFASAGSSVEFHWVTTYSYDDMGRPGSVVEPDGRSREWYYAALDDTALFITLSYPHVSGSNFYGPVGYSVTNHAERSVFEGTIAVSGGSTTTTQVNHVDETDDDWIDTVDALGDVVHISATVYNDSGLRVEERRVFHTTPSSYGSASGSDYDSTEYTYDDMGRRTITEAPHGTITKLMYSVPGQVTQREVGTDNSGGGGHNMVVVEELEYDDGSTGGNRYLTKRTLPVDSTPANDRVTKYTHDVRGRVLIVERPEAPHSMFAYDNMGRETEHGYYSTAPGSAASPAGTSTNRVALWETDYDDRGQVWQRTTHEINTSSGVSDDTINHEYWYDSEGRLAQAKAGQLRKLDYDRLGRQTHEFILAVDDDDDSNPSTNDYAQSLTVSGDIVLEEHQTVYSDDSNDMILEAAISRFYDDYGGSETTGVLDTNGDGDIFALTFANLEGRAQITAHWYDALNRRVDTVRYGTNGGSTFDRNPGVLTAPSRDDSKLRTTYDFDDAGRLSTVEDPRGLVALREYDDAGRVTKTVRNYDASVNGGNPSGTDDNRTTEVSYDKGLRDEITEVMPNSSDNQVTTFGYGTIAGTGEDSRVATEHLLKSITYPYTTGGGAVAPVVTFSYNRQGDVIWREDQSGNKFTTSYDDAGRWLETELTYHVDGDDEVEKITATYSNRGQLASVTQYDDTPDVLDSMTFSYDGWGLVDKMKQDHDSAVGASPVNGYEQSFTYAKATGGRATVRRSTATLPSGTVTTLLYDTSNYHDDASRVSSLKRGTTEVVEYEYLGFDTRVGVNYPVPDLAHNYYGTSGTYPGFDEFNRIVCDKWKSSAGAVPVEMYWEYDRNANLVSLEDGVYDDGWSGEGFAILVVRDGLNRIESLDIGAISSGSISTPKTLGADWVLDHVANWDEFELDLNGDGDAIDYGGGDLNETRTHNKSNEITARDTNSSAPAEFEPDYDARGSLTDDDDDRTYEYDVWNRLRFVRDASANLIAEFRYNGIGQVIAVHEDTDSDSDVDGSDAWRHNVWDERGRLVATFLDADTTPTHEFVSHESGAGEAIQRNNEIVLRNSTPLYYLQNGKGDTVAIVDANGVWMESVKYMESGMPHGIPAGDMDGDWDVDHADEVAIQAIITAIGYDIEADLNLDGDVDGDDITIAQDANHSGKSLGRGVLSSFANRVGAGGKRWEQSVSLVLHDSGAFSTELGSLHRWASHDGGRGPNGGHLRRNPMGGVGLDSPPDNCPRLILECQAEYVRCLDQPVGVNPPGQTRAKERRCYDEFISCLKGCVTLAGRGDGLEAAAPGVCDHYGENRTYIGVNMRCFCKCMGDSTWSKIVRSCLLRMDLLGADVHVAHDFCYKMGSEVEPAPLVSLILCSVRCKE